MKGIDYGTALLIAALIMYGVSFAILALVIYQ
jgi:hypothetical protein